MTTITFPTLVHTLQLTVTVGLIFIAGQQYPVTHR
jgi:hypothetical protein